jgi:hypothetical protein
MGKIKRKFLSEFGMNLCSARWLLMPATQLSSDGTMRAEEEEISKNCHIYLICERPAISFDKTDFSYDGENVSGSLVFRIEGREYREHFSQNFPLLDGATRLELSKYPHREIQTFNEKGEQIRYLPASALSISPKGNPASHIFRKLHILYIGQAFGNGSRTARDRLKNHATLQKILAEASYNSPDGCVRTVR